METVEHRAAGDQIKIQTFGNRYLSGSKQLTTTNPTDTLRVRMMQNVGGIPVPLNLQLSAGEIVSLAGDYYTKAGWGSELTLPENTGDPENDNKRLFWKPVRPNETKAFLEAYSDLASDKVTRDTIDRIYAIEEDFGQIRQQVAYMRTVDSYKTKLENNEDHFTPWSVRAYMVGHHTAMQSASIARACHLLDKGNITEDSISVPQELRDALALIRADKDTYKLSGIPDNKLYKELGDRYHAQAVAQDLFTMHFYSDHFAAGHMSRMGLLRKTVPQEFGFWGSILINNMHNEDNMFSAAVTNPYQPGKLSTLPLQDQPAFPSPREDCNAYGDGTYFERFNDENSNLLINGMNNSLGDIARCIETGTKRLPRNYGGLAFMPEIDYNKRQTQPLLIQGVDGATYCRKDINTIKMLSPIEYKETLCNPTENGYEKLTRLNAFWLVMKTRVFGVKPAIEPIDDIREANIKADEQYLTESPQEPQVSPALRLLGERVVDIVRDFTATQTSANTTANDTLIPQEEDDNEIYLDIQSTPVSVCG